MSKFGYAYVFDYSVAKIYEIELDEQDNQEETNDVLDRRGLKIDDCYVMFTENKTSVEPIKLKEDVESI